MWSNLGKPEGKKFQKENGGVYAMASAFTHMAKSVASAFSQPDNQKAHTPTKTISRLSHSQVGISPGKRIELQETLFKQIDMLHNMYERGAITSLLFENRRDLLLAQMDKLNE